MSGSPREGGLAGALRDMQRRLSVLERTAQGPITRAASASADRVDLVADAQWHVGASVDVAVPGASFRRLSLQLSASAGQTVSGTGNSWIGSWIAAIPLDADGAVVAPVSLEGAGASTAFTPFHPDGGPASATSSGSVLAVLPPECVAVRVEALYALGLAGQVKDGGPATGNTFVAATLEFSRP